MPDPVLQSDPHPLSSVEWSGGQRPTALGLQVDVTLTQLASRSAARHPPGLEGHYARNAAEQHSASTTSHRLGVMALQLRHRPEPSQCSPSGHSSRARGPAARRPGAEREQQRRESDEGAGR